MELVSNNLFFAANLPNGASGNIEIRSNSVTIKLVKSEDVWKVFANGNFITSGSYRKDFLFTGFRYVIYNEGSESTTSWLTDFLATDLGG